MTAQPNNTLESTTVDELRNLARTNLASAEGFKTAANDVGDPQLMDLFLTVAGERRRFATELAEVLALNLEEPPEHGKLAGALHRWWIDLRSRFSDDPYAVLAEAERGEDHIKHAYEDALTKTAGSAVNDMLQRQYTRVKAVHDQVRDLRDRAKARKKAG